MKMLSLQEAYARKLQRQTGMRGLQIHAAGHCAHVGRISPGCYACFSSTPCWSVRLGEDVGLPNVCNMDCVHCFRDRLVQQDYRVPSGWTMSQKARDDILRFFVPYNRLTDLLPLYSFSGVSEPLFYLPVIEQYMDYLRNVIEKDILKTRGWAKVYTNGTRLNKARILKLRDLGIDEVRVNPSASGFSESVYHSIDMAAKVLPVVTVEVPAWPPYRKRLFDMLPIIDRCGVSHLDICQVEVMNQEGLERISQAFPDAEFYQGHWLMLDDGGMVEDIMREVLEKGYAYSVIDCNAFVKQVYHNPWMKQCLHRFCDTRAAGDVYAAAER